MKLGLTIAALVAATGVASFARASEGLPVVVEYSAPEVCASTEAFDVLLRAQLARSPKSERPWRFSVAIRRAQGDGFDGTLTTESGVRTLHAQTCDDVVAALTLVIAMATPEDSATPPVEEQPPPSLPPPPPIAMMPIVPIAASRAPRAQVEPDHVAVAQDDGPAWRIGARFQDWTNNAWLTAMGPTIDVSIEPHWGAYRMLFELAGGALFSSLRLPAPVWAQSPVTNITWALVDFQTCPLDVALGRTGVSILGCTRVAVATTTSATGALFFGAGGRVRWQSTFRLFVEAHLNGLYGTQSAPLYGSPAWMDLGGALGFRI